MDAGILHTANHDGLRFTIESEGEEVGGYFLWVKREDGTDIDEHFEDTIERCKAKALETYGVPIASWR